jgi:hypothetical protein
MRPRHAPRLPYCPYYHVVFTLPARIADIAYQNKAVIYDLLFKSETMLTIAADFPVRIEKSLGNFVGQGAIISAHKLSRRKITGGDLCINSPRGFWSPFGPPDHVP